MSKRDMYRWARSQNNVSWPRWVRVLVILGLLAACGIAYHNWPK